MLTFAEYLKENSWVDKVLKIIKPKLPKKNGEKPYRWKVKPESRTAFVHPMNNMYRLAVTTSPTSIQVHAESRDKKAERLGGYEWTTAISLEHKSKEIKEMVAAVCQMYVTILRKAKQCPVDKSHGYMTPTIENGRVYARCAEGDAATKSIGKLPRTNTERIEYAMKKYGPTPNPSHTV